MADITGSSIFGPSLTIQEILNKEETMPTNKEASPKGPRTPHQRVSINTLFSTSSRGNPLSPGGRRGVTINAPATSAMEKSTLGLSQMVSSRNLMSFAARQDRENERIANDNVLSLPKVLCPQGIESDSDDDLIVNNPKGLKIKRQLDKADGGGKGQRAAHKGARLRRTAMWEVVITSVLLAIKVQESAKKQKAMSKLSNLMFPMMLRRTMLKAKSRRRYVSDANKAGEGGPGEALQMSTSLQEIPDRPSVDQLYRQCPHIFEGMNRYFLTRLVEKGMELISYDDKELVLKEGEVNFGLYCVAKGSCVIASGVNIRTLLSSGDGAAGVTHSGSRTLYKGAIFGELLDAPCANPSHTMARGQLLLWRLTKEKFESIVKAERESGALLKEIHIKAMKRSFEVMPKAYPLCPDLFRHIPIFKLWPEEALMDASESFVPRIFEKDDVIFKEGQPSAGVYIILTGEVGLYRGSKITQHAATAVQQEQAKIFAVATPKQSLTRENHRSFGEQPQSRRSSSQQDNDLEETPETFSPSVFGPTSSSRYFQTEKEEALTCATKVESQKHFTILNRGVLHDVTYADVGTTGMASSHRGEGEKTGYQILGHRPYLVVERHRFTSIVHSEIMRCWYCPESAFINLTFTEPDNFLNLRRLALDKRARTVPKLKPDQLSRVPLLASLPRARQEKLCSSLLVSKVLEKGTVLTTPNEPVECMYLIASGDLKAGNGPHGRSLEDTFFPRDMVALAEKDMGISKAPIPTTTTTNHHHKGEGLTVTMVGNIEDHPQHIHRPPSNASNHTGSDKDPRRTMRSRANREDGDEVLPWSDPQRPVKHIGGGWEGLLVGTWEEVWKCTTVVELWVLPVAVMRAEYNACSKTLQSTLLATARAEQQAVLGSVSPESASLPILTKKKKGSGVTESGSSGESGPIARFGRSAPSLPVRDRSQDKGGGKSSKKAPQRASVSTSSSSATDQSAGVAPQAQRHQQQQQQQQQHKDDPRKGGAGGRGSDRLEESNDSLTNHRLREGAPNRRASGRARDMTQWLGNDRQGTSPAPPGGGLPRRQRGSVVTLAEEYAVPEYSVDELLSMKVVLTAEQQAIRDMRLKTMDQVIAIKARAKKAAAKTHIHRPVKTEAQKALEAGWLAEEEEVRHEVEVQHFKGEDEDPSLQVQRILYEAKKERERSRGPESPSASLRRSPSPIPESMVSREQSAHRNSPHRRSPPPLPPVAGRSPQRATRKYTAREIELYASNKDIDLEQAIDRGLAMEEEPALDSASKNNKKKKPVLSRPPTAGTVCPTGPPSRVGSAKPLRWPQPVDGLTMKMQRQQRQNSASSARGYQSHTVKSMGGGNGGGGRPQTGRPPCHGPRPLSGRSDVPIDKERRQIHSLVSTFIRQQQNPAKEDHGPDPTVTSRLTPHAPHTITQSPLKQQNVQFRPKAIESQRQYRERSAYVHKMLHSKIDGVLDDLQQ